MASRRLHGSSQTQEICGGDEIPKREDIIVRFEVFTSVTMKNAVFWDIRTQFLPYKSTLRLRYRIQPVNPI
jgi:hypothetical protein